MKPVKHYDVKEGMFHIFIGQPAYVMVYKEDGKPSIVRTSEVWAYNKTTGEFETQNTLYIPV